MDKDGYGKHGCNSERAHRVAYKQFVGPIPGGMLVCHSCDNRLCCNPAHLFLGSPRDNTRDMIAKDRQHWVGNTTERQAKIVKSLLAAGFRICDAAFIAGCKYSVAKLINRNKCWQYVQALELNA